MSVRERRRVAVCATSELPVGARRLLTVDGRPIACFNVQGDYYAIGARCPHRGAGLIDGTVCGTMLESDPHEYRYGRDQQLLRCPWHGWQFELRSGRSITDERTGVPSYPVQVIDGEIQILVDV
jgi:nitrite reductase (NADH) small subunit